MQVTPVSIPRWADKYLAELEEHGMPYTAAKAAGTTVRAVERLAEASADFAYYLECATEAAADKVEAEVRRRAIDGIDKGVYYQGDLVATEKQYSDSLLTLLAKAKRRNQFGDRAEISGPGGAPLTVNIRSFSANLNATIGPALAQATTQPAPRLHHPHGVLPGSAPTLDSSDDLV